MKTILQIEDIHANRLLVQRVLKPLNYHLIQAPDGETGVGLAIEHKPDLILLDVGLPDIDGQTIVTLIRQIPDLQKTPIVVITALPKEQAKEIAERYNCNGWITKPIDIRRFPDQIAGYLESTT